MAKTVEVHANISKGAKKATVGLDPEVYARFRAAVGVLSGGVTYGTIRVHATEAITEHTVKLEKQIAAAREKAGDVPQLPSTPQGMRRLVATMTPEQRAEAIKALKGS